MTDQTQDQAVNPSCQHCPAEKLLKDRFTHYSHCLFEPGKSQWSDVFEELNLILYRAENAAWLITCIADQDKGVNEFSLRDVMGIAWMLRNELKDAINILHINFKACREPKNG